MSWSALPEVIQHLIIAKLPAASLWALRCVGPELRRAASQDDHWQRLGFVSFELALELKELEDEAAVHEAAEHEAAEHEAAEHETPDRTRAAATPRTWVCDGTRECRLCGREEQSEAGRAGAGRARGVGSSQ